MPTLVITFEVDAAAERAEKARKRRSSRAGILQAQTSPYPNSLLFRTVPEQRYSIYDWQVTIQPRIQPNTPNTPDFAENADPAFAQFKNPFTKGGERPQISKPILRPEPFHRYSHTKDFGSNRSNPASLMSPSPSLRSQRSDISSQSSLRPRGYAGVLPIQHTSDELPSPASTLGYEEQFISGWTNAQGRSSALSNHVTSHQRTCSVSTTSTPPIVRETILDRAFNLNLIPGADRVPSSDSGEGTMSSIARFEALMQEHERRKKAAENSRPSTKEKDQWSLAEEGDSDTEGSSHPPSHPPSRATNEDLVRENFFDDATHDEDEEDLDEIPLKAQRALEYIMGGRSSTSPVLPMRPKSSRTKSHNNYYAPPIPQPPAPMEKEKVPPMPSRRQRPMSFSHGHSRKASQDAGYAVQSLSPQAANRLSGSSVKRLSFSDFAKRLSSNGSLLLVQTNSRNSAASSAASTYHEEDKENINTTLEEGVIKGLTASRLSGMNQANIRPGMGARRSTVAAETRGYNMGGYEEVQQQRHGQERAVPMGRERMESEKDCIQQWRGSGLFAGHGDGGFL